MASLGQINRRVLVGGGATLVAYALISPRPASALSLKGLVHSVGKVATTIVQGATSLLHEVKAIGHDAEQAATQVEQTVLPLVKTGVKLIGEVVQEAEGASNSVLSLINSVEGAAGTIAGQVGNLALQGLSQAFMLHVNSGIDDMPVSYVATQAAVPMDILTSDLGHDPFQFVADNADSLAKHVSSRPYETVVYQNSVSGRSYQTGRVTGASPGGQGYYPSVMSVGNLLSLVSLFLA